MPEGGIAALHEKERRASPAFFTRRREVKRVFLQNLQKACVRMRGIFPADGRLFRKADRRENNTPVYAVAGKKNSLQRRATLRKEYER